MFIFWGIGGTHSSMYTKAQGSWVTFYVPFEFSNFKFSGNYMVPKFGISGSKIVWRLGDISTYNISKESPNLSIFTPYRLNIVFTYPQTLNYLQPFWLVSERTSMEITWGHLLFIFMPYYVCIERLYRMK